MAKEQGKKGFLERPLAAYEKLQYAIGAVALGGAALLPEYSGVLIGVAAIQVLEGAAIRLWRNRKSGNSAAPQPAPS
jgi:hypothetical protein